MLCIFAQFTIAFLSLRSFWLAHKVAVNKSIILYLVRKLSRGESTSKWHSAVSLSRHSERWTANMPSDVGNDRPMGTVAYQISGPRLRGTFKKQRARCLTGKLMKVTGSCLLELHLIFIVACVRVNQMLAVIWNSSCVWWMDGLL